MILMINSDKIVDKIAHACWSYNSDENAKPRMTKTAFWRCVLLEQSTNPIEYGIRNANGASVSGIVLNPLNSLFPLDHGAFGVLSHGPQKTLLVGERWFMAGVSLAPPRSLGATLNPATT
ncbi:hypothetical protein EV1_043724 [Malus domestica]